MSGAAKEFYAGQFPDRELPPVLSGEPMELWYPNERIPVRYRSGMWSPNFGPTYCDTLVRVGEFIISKQVDPAQDEFGDEYRTTSDLTSFRNARHATHLLGKGRLIPANVTTGYVKELQIQAIAPEDMPPTLLERVAKETSEYPNDSERVFLLESGRLVLGSTNVNVSHVTTIVADAENSDGFSFIGTAPRKNEQLVKAGLHRANTIRAAARHEIVQDVGRGRRSR